MIWVPRVAEHDVVFAVRMSCVIPSQIRCLCFRCHTVQEKSIPDRRPIRHLPEYGGVISRACRFAVAKFSTASGQRSIGPLLVNRYSRVPQARFPHIRRPRHGRDRLSGRGAGSRPIIDAPRRCSSLPVRWNGQCCLYRQLKMLRYFHVPTFVYTVEFV